MSDSQPASANKAVFLSYASQDAGAVERIAVALRAAGVEVWFDKNELTGGDAWDAKIRGQIKSCALFVPVISANTQQREEGYFRREWNLAASRTLDMAHDKAFLLPVVIDATSDAAAKVPEKFREVQWTRLPGGETPEKFCARVKKLLDGEVAPLGSVADRAPHRQPDPQSQSRASRSWLVPTLLVGAGSAVAIAIWQPWRVKEKLAPSTPPAAAIIPTAPRTEAQQLVAKARKILDEGDEMNRETYTLAEELLKKAEALDVTEASAWALHAQLSSDMLVFGLDTSSARFEAIQAQASRATKLAPDSLEAALAAAEAQTRARQDLDGVLRRMQALAAKYPDDWRVWRTMGRVAPRAGKTEEGLSALDRALQLLPDDPRLKSDQINLLNQTGRFSEMESALAKALAGRTSARLGAFDVSLKLMWWGDSAGATAAVQRLPAWFLSEDRGSSLAGLAYLWAREPKKALEIVNGFRRDYIRDYFFLGPRAVLTAWAHESAGEVESAKADWQIVLRVADRELSGAPDDAAALHWKAWALARLERTDEADRLLRLLAERTSDTRDTRILGFTGIDISLGRLAALATTLGRADMAIEQIAQSSKNENVRSFAQFRPITRGTLRLNPVFDPLRSDPRFQALIDATPGPEEKKESKTSAAPAPVVSDKSLVVLPLENLSPDPENAFFTDGMHAEIIATLQRTTDLRVIGRDSALAFKRGSTTVAEFAQRVAAGYVLTGSVRRAGTKARILLELRRASDDALLWSSPNTERELTDIFAVQSEVAEQVARVLQARVATGSFVLARFTTQNPKAYDLFIRAFTLFNSNSGSPVGLDLSAFLATIQNAEEAMILDPNFAGAASLLALANWWAYRTDQDPLTRLRYAAESKRWAETAARLVPGGAGDYGLASYHGQLERDYARGLSYAQNVVRALPNEATAYNYVGIFSSALGQDEEALSAWRRAITLDPLRPVYWINYLQHLVALRRVGAFQEERSRYHASTGGQDIPEWQYFLAGELPASLDGMSSSVRVGWLWRARRVSDVATLAAAELGKSETKDLDRLIYLRYQTDALQKLGRKEDAEKSAVALMALVQKLAGFAEVSPSQKHFQLALALARLGRTDEAVDAARRHMEAVRMAAPRLLLERELEVAELYAYLNRPRECVELLAKLLRAPTRVTGPSLKVDPAWDNVREDAGFKALLVDPKNSVPM